MASLPRLITRCQPMVYQDPLNLNWFWVHAGSGGLSWGVVRAHGDSRWRPVTEKYATREDAQEALDELAAKLNFTRKPYCVGMKAFR